MKWFLILITLIVACAYGRLYDTSTVDPSCWPELNHTKDVLLDCLDLGRFDGEQVQTEIYTTLFQPNHDENAVRQFGVKYCDIAYDLMKCVPIILNITEECLPIPPQMGRNLKSGLKRSLDYICDNNAEALVQLVISNATFIIKDNINLAAECGGFVQNATLVAKDSDDSANLIRMCDAMNEANKCHLEWMEPIGNIHLINFINASNVISAEELGCEKWMAPNLL